jgi:hypothetical protein
VLASLSRLVADASAAGGGEDGFGAEPASGSADAGLAAPPRRRRVDVGLSFAMAGAPLLGRLAGRKWENGN